MATYGSASTSGYGIASAGQLRGSVYGEWPDDAWVTSISARLGRNPSGSNSTARMGLYTTANENPNNLVGQTAAFTVTAPMDHGGSGSVYTQALSVRVPKGGNYAIGIVGTGGELYYAMVPAASSPFANRNHYYRSGVTGSLPNPFGYTSTSYEGNISAYATYTVNRAPTASNSGPSGLITTSSVAFKGNFSDPDSSLGDKMLRFRYVVQTSGGTGVYDSGWVAATSTEAANNQFNRSRTLSPGNYRWQCQVQDQFGEESALTSWTSFQVHANRAPTATTSTPSGLQTSSTVNFQGTFADPDTTITGDTFHRFQFQVIRTDVSPNTVVHNSGWLVPNSTEISNKKFSRNVTLTAGIPLAWRTQVQDNLGAQSAWTAYKAFNINAGGGADTLSGVTGKQNTQQPTPFGFVYRHPNSLAMNRYQLRIGQGSQTLATGLEVATAANANTVISASWSTSFGSFKIPWGADDIWWEVRVRDSANAWSSYVRAGTKFNVNAAPSIPTNLTPTNSAASPNRPLLKAKAVDDDGDTVTIKARIKNSVGTVLQTRTMTKNGDWFTYQTTSSDLADYGTFSWDAYSYDGYLYSGEQVSEANAQKSASSTFIYAAVPDVIVTSPVADQVYAGAIEVKWNAVANQQAYRIVISDVETDTQISSGNWTSSTATSESFTAAQLGFRKGKAYSVVVELRDTNGLVGTSSVTQFLIDYELPSPIDLFIATPEMVGNDTYPTAIHINWNRYEGTDFQRYTVVRMGNEYEESTILAVITNQNVNEMTDLVPPTNREVEYSIVLTTMQGIDEIESEPAVAVAEIELKSVILQNVIQPNQHIALLFDSDRSYKHVNDSVLEMPWGSNAPVAIHGAATYEVFSGSFNLFSVESQSAKEQVNALRNMFQSKQTINYRDERGRRMFGTITSFGEKDVRIGNYTVELQITETTYREGVEV